MADQPLVEFNIRFVEFLEQLARFLSHHKVNDPPVFRAAFPSYKLLFFQTVIEESTCRMQATTSANLLGESCAATVPNDVPFFCQNAEPSLAIGRDTQVRRSDVTVFDGDGFVPDDYRGALPVKVKW